MDLTVPFTGADGSATDSVILLKNGGGKSALLSLIFSVIRPALREFMRPREERGRGRDEDVRALGDYVLRDDHGVVVLEWELDGVSGSDLPHHLLTGVFLERKAAARTDGPPEADGGVRRVYFSYYTVADVPATRLEALPLYTDSSRRFRYPSTGFVARLDELADAAPHAQVLHTEQQNEWIAALLARGIDADIFAYELRMNQREGGAKDLFASCTTVEAYLDLFLEVLADRSLGEGLRDNLHQHREKLIRRKTELVPGRVLTARLMETLEPIREIAAARRDLREKGQTLTSRLRAMQAYGNARLTALREERGSLIAMRDEAVSDAAARRAEAVDARRSAARMQRDIALVTAQAAQAEKERVETQRAEMERLAKGWRLAAPLREALLQETTAAKHRAEVVAREREHAPLLDRAQAAARRYYAALTAHFAVLTERAEGVEGDIAAAEAAAEEANKRATEAARLAATERARADRATARATEVAREHQRLITAGALREPTEPLPDAEQRTVRSIASAKDVETSVEADLRSASEDLARRRADTREAAGLAQQARGDVALATQVLSAGMREAQRVAGLRTLQRVLELDTVDGTMLGEDAVLLLRQAARAAYERALAARARSAIARRNVAALQETGLLPVSTDVDAVLAELRPAVHQAHAGWQYLAGAFGVAEASEIVDRAPDIALGVVVADAEYDGAVDLLRRNPPAVEAPVRVVRQSDVHGTSGTAGFVARPATNAHFDRGAGAIALAREEARLTTIDEDASTAETEYETLHGDATTVQNFIRAYGRTWFEERHRAVSAAETAAKAANEALTRAAETEKVAEAREQDARAHLQSVRDNKRTLEQHGRDIRAFRERYGDDVVAATREAQAARVAQVSAERVEADARAEREGYKTRIGEWQRIRQGLAGDLAVAQQTMREVRYVDPPVPAAPGDRDVLEREYRLAVDSYDRKIDSHGLLALASAAEREANGKREELRSGLAKQKHGWSEATLQDLLASLPVGSDLRTELDRIEEEQSRLFSQSGHVGKSAAQAEATLSAARTACEQANIAMTPDEERARLTELGADPDGVLRREWESMRGEALAVAARADADMHAAEAVQAEALADLALVQEAEAKVNGGCEVLNTAERQHEDFLRAFVADPSIVAAHTPVDDDAFRAAAPTWAEERSQLLEAWQKLDKKRDSSVRTISGILSTADPVIVPPFLARLRDAEPDIIESHIEEIAGDIARRHDEIMRAIADVDIHRRELVDIALLAGEEGRRRVRALGKAAVVPTRVLSFGGVPFLKVDGTHASDQAIERAAIEALLESLTDAGAQVPTALSLIQMATRALLPDIRMSVLYPKPEQVSAEYWPITRLGKMSGGEGLTIATLLYCTLARVRAMNRGANDAASGVLLFDNPFGIASSATFVTMQREVARAFGVQLIYFTGVLDLEAIRLLPNRVRLGAVERDRARGYMLVRPIPGDPIAEALRDADAAAERPLEPVQLIAKDETFLYDEVVATLNPTVGTRASSVGRGAALVPNS